jgi:hypothetical protein
LGRDKPRKHKRKRRRHHHGRHSPRFTGKVRAARTTKTWRTVDTDLGLAILWTVDSDGRYRAGWEVPLDAHTGKYRFVITANRYGLKSKPFTVRASHALTATPVNAGAGAVAVELRYPEASSHEAVGDPPGDLTADLTDRPEVAASGLATFHVNGRSVTVSERPGGVFAVEAPPGATVSVEPGSVRDEYGNANSNSLTLHP